VAVHGKMSRLKVAELGRQAKTETKTNQTV